MILARLPSLLAAAAILLFGTAANAALPTINFVREASQIGAHDVRMDARVTANGENATWVIEYGLTTDYGSTSQVSTVDAGTFVEELFTITGLAPSTTYHFRCKATSTAGSVFSTDHMFTTIAPVPVVTATAPTATPKLLPAGGSTTLNMSVTAGTGPFTYTWKRGTTVVQTGSQSYLHLNSITTLQAGSYTCLVSNPESSSTSPALVISVVSIAPTSVAVNEGGAFSITASITPANAAATYAWRVNGSSTPSDIGTVTGLNLAKITVAGVKPAADGNYVCTVGLGSDTANLLTDVNVSLKPVVDPVGSLYAYVSQAFDLPLTASQSPTSMTVTGLPAGLVFNKTTRHITGKVTIPSPFDEPFVITVTATNAVGTGPATKFTLTIQPIDPAVIGSFNATIDRNADVAGLGGKLTLKLTPTGACTGSLTLGTAVYPINKPVDVDSGGSVTLAALQLKSGANPALDLRLNLFSNVCNGSVTSPAGTATVSGYQTYYSAARPFVSAGLFNCTLTPGSTEFNAPAFPHGTSLGAATVKADGTVTWAGRMADGSVFTASSAMGSFGYVPIFSTLYGGTGSVIGAPVFFIRTVSGAFSWKKNSVATGRLYRSGFADHALNVAGARYVKPLTALDQLVMGLDNTTSNVHVVFDEGGLTSQIDQTFTITLLNTVVMPTGVALNPKTVAVTLTIGDGSVKGSFTLVDPNPLGAGTVTRKADFFGLIINSSNSAEGFFTLAKLPSLGPPATNTSVATNDMLSGRVMISGIH